MDNTKYLVLLVNLFFFQALIAQNHQHHDHTHEHDLVSEGHYLKEISLDEDFFHQAVQNRSKSITVKYLNQDIAFELHEFKFYDGDINPVPGMKAFRMRAMDNSLLQGRLVVSSQGVNLMFLNQGIMVRQYYQHTDSGKRYVEEKGISFKDMPHSNCGPSSQESIPGQILEGKKSDYTESINKRFGNHKRVFRVAVVTSGEYYRANGNNGTAVRAAVVEQMIAISFIYEQDLNVQLIQATGSPRADYTDPLTDPFIPQGERTGMAGREVEDNFNSNRYDIGHLFHTHPNGGDWLANGGGSGGVAALGSVCREGSKGNGWSGSFDNSTNGFISLAAHEYGHQFGARHTWNGEGGSCDAGNISLANTYEMASGVTVMSYNGICGAGQNVLSATNEVSSEAFNYFHVASLVDMTRHLESAVAADCNIDDWILDVNNEPVANADPCGAVYRIPTSTPFFITGEGTDVDGDTLLYTWEQFDNDPSGGTQGEIGDEAAMNNAGPIFRCYPPNRNPTRYIPKRGLQLEGFNSYEFEVLPRRARSLTMRFIVRDNAFDGGAIDYDEVNIQVVSANFRITSPNGGESFTAGEDLRVEWDLDGAESLCDRAQIRISVDGGNSFPYVAAGDVDFGKGFEDITIPVSVPASDRMRFQVICADYECFGFYDFSNDDIQLNSQCNSVSSEMCNTEPLIVDFRDQELDLANPIALGFEMVNYIKEVEPVPPTMELAAFSNASRDGCNQRGTDNPFDQITITPTESGVYHFEFNDDGSRDIRAYSVFDKATFNSDNACESFVGSNTHYSGSQFIARRYMRVDLEACREYVLISQVTTNNAFNTAIRTIYGPGQLMGSTLDNVTTTFVAVSAATNLITAVSETGDFVSLIPGEYRIHSVVYDGVNPDSFIGESLSRITNMGCTSSSSGFKPITINSSCAIVDLEVNTTEACSFIDNLYNVTLSFRVELGPTTGNIIVNEQSFPINGSSFELELVDLLADGQPVDLEFTFTADDGCAITQSAVFIAPENCCRIDLDLGDQRLCLGETAVLDAGNDGLIYTWFMDGDLLSVNTQTLDATVPGDYMVIVEDINGCQKSDFTTVAFDTPPVAEITTEDVDDACPGDDVLIRSDVTNFDSIAWLLNGVELEDFTNDRTISVKDGGIYEIQAFNGGCMVNDFITVALLPTTTFSLDTEDVQECLGFPITITASDPDLDYTWELFGDGEVASGTNTITLPGESSDESGRYIAIGVNEFGCEFRDTARVDFENIPEINLGEDLEGCADEFFNLRSDHSPIEWFVNGELQGFSTGIFNSAPAGTIEAVATISENCIVRDTIVITVFESPPLEAGPNLSFCEGSIIDTTIVVGERNGTQYTYLRNGQTITGVSSFSGELRITEPGSYDIIAQDTETRCNSIDNIIVEFVSNPTITLVDAPQSLCSGNEETITVDASTAGIAWFLDGSLLDESEPSITISEPGTYEAFVGFNQDCEASVSVTVDVIPSPMVNLPEIVESCSGIPVDLTGTNDNSLTIRWLRDGVIIPGAESGTFTAVESGQYIIAVSDAMGCQSRDTSNVVFQDNATVELPDELTFCTGDIGTITANTTANLLSWFNGTELLPFTERIIEVTEPGTYRAVAQEGQACEVSDIVEVSFADRPDVMLQADNACQGSDLVVIAGPDGDFEYSWFINGDPVTNQSGTLILTETDLGGLTGDVSVSVKNIDNDCFTEAETPVTFLDGTTISLSLEGASCGAGDGRIIADTDATTLQWFFEGMPLTETGTSLEITQEGTYTATAGMAPCIAEESIDVTFGNAPDIMIVDQFACGAEDAMFVAGPDGAFEYSWTINGFTQNETSGTLVIPFGSIPTGRETIEVTAKNLNDDCETSSEATVEFLDLPELSLTPPTDLCEGNPEFLVANSDQSTIAWFQDGDELDETSAVLSVETSGLYLAEVRNGGCIVRDSVELDFADSPDIEIGNISSCSSADAVFVAGSDDYQYEWTVNQFPLPETSGTLTISSGLIPGDMAEIGVTATGSNGCQTFRTATVQFIESSDLSLSAPQAVCEGESAFITAETDVTALSWFRDGVPLQETDDRLEITEPGLYLAIAGAGTCATRDSVLVTADSFVEGPMISLSNVTSCASDDAVFTAGSDDLDYEWFIGGVAQLETSGTLTLSSNMVPGGIAEITVIAINDDGCSAMAMANVEFTDSPLLTLETPTGACVGESVTITSETNVSSLVWFFDGDQLMEDGTSLVIDESGTYTAVAGTGICAARDSIMIEFAEAPDISLASQQECAGVPATFVAGPDGDFEYVWFIDNEEQSEQSGTFVVNASDINGLTAMVSVQAIDRTQGCSTTLEASVEFLDAPSLAILDPGPVCEGSSTFLVADTDVQNIEWFIDGVMQTTTETSIEITVEGEYEARAGSGMCGVSESLTITLQSAPEIELGNESECIGEIAEFIAGPDGEYEYVWTVDGEEVSETSGTLRLDESEIGGMSAVVTVVATNLDGSCPTQLEAILEFLDTPSLAILDPGPVCEGSATFLEVDTDVQAIEWLINGEVQATTGTSIEITEEGEYEARAGSGMCGVSETITITLQSAPDANIANQSKCTGEIGEFVAGPDGEFLYVWLVDGEEVSETSGTLTLDDTQISGTNAIVSVIATNLDGSCATESEAILEFLDTPELSIDAPADICAGQIGELTAQTDVQTLRWFLGSEELPQTTTTIEITESGDYRAIAGSGDCAVEEMITVTFSDAPQLSIDADMEACTGEPVEVNLTNDTSEPVVWSLGNTTLPDQGNSINALESGTYTAMVTNSAGCSSEVSVEIEFLDFPMAEILNLPMGVCEGAGFEIEAESDGDRFEWFDENGPISGATGLTQEFNESGDYTFVAYNRIDCPTEIPFTLEFIPAPSADLGADIRECADQDVQLEIANDPDVEYEWFLNGSPLGETGNSITATESGEYSVVATNSSVGCSSDDSVIVELVDFPMITNTTGSDQISICDSESGTLSISSDSDMLTWTLDGATIAEDVDNIDVTEPGTYIVTATTDIGCETSFEFEVDVIILDMIQLADVSLCPGDDAVTLSIPGDFDSYLWSGVGISETTQSITIPWTAVQAITSNTVTVMGARDGCEAESSFELTFFPEVTAAVVDINPQICVGENVQLDASGGQNYSWTDPNNSLSGTNIANPIASPDVTTTYQLNVTDSNCPAGGAQLEVTVTVNPLPDVTAGDDVSTIPGESVTLIASGANTYEWDNEDLIDGSSFGNEVEVNISEETTFTVIGTDINGCSSSDEVVVSIVNDPSRVITVINALTPNGDDANDVLEFAGLELFPDNRIAIFNRWGNIVFEKRGYQNDDVRWDGMRNGEELPAGTYYYILEFGEFQIKNSLTIIRE